MLCIHRAPLSTHERMVGFLIEHYAGKFPVWLCPEQVRIIPITESHNDYALQLKQRLQDAGIRSDADLGNDRMNAKIRQALVSACRNQTFVGQAPVVIAACSTNPTRVMSSGWSAAAVDLAIAVDHMTLAAVELGLGTCWIGAFDAPAVAKLLGLPPDAAVVHVLPLGYPVHTPGPHRAKSADEIICHETWS